MDDTLIGLFERTMRNCEFYEKEKLPISLANEIGVLRGISYCMDLAGVCSHTEKFLHFIDVQQKLKKCDKKL